MDNKDFKVLNEIYKGSKMGMESITYLEDTIVDNNFKEQVRSQYNDYKEISENIENILEANNGNLDTIPAKDKIIGWTSVKMNTMVDPTTSHMSEMLIQGTVMGIIEGVRLSNQNPNLDRQAEEIVDKFVKIGEDNIQILKKYL